MPQSRLHTFDQHLCWHVGYNTNQLIHAIPASANVLGEPLLSFVDEVIPQGIWLQGPNQLLSEYDLNRLAWAMAMLPGKPYWMPLPHITDLWHDCTDEIITDLSREMVMPWWQFSLAMESQLAGDTVAFEEGVDLIIEWTRMIRSYLRAMGKRHLVPAPEGGFPTPRCNPTDNPIFEASEKEKAKGPSAVEVPLTADSLVSHSDAQNGGITVLVQDVRRIADTLDPPDQTIVDSPYVAHRLGCTATWVSNMVRKGDIPARCLVKGTGNGKPWKFYREQIDQWISMR